MLKFIINYEITRKNLNEKFTKFYVYNFRILFYRIFIRFKYTLLVKLHLINLFHNCSFISADIETYGYCNRSCEFCFNNPKFPQREKGVMSEEMWKKIIDELSNLRYKGRISPHFYGEPLLDKRLANLISYARAGCPDSYILIDTNGDYLNENLMKRLISSGVNKFFVTSYDESIPDHLRLLRNKFPANISLRSHLDFKKVNRSGKIFDVKTVCDKICYNPTFQLIIDWQGDVLLCCMDYYKEVTFGNVKDYRILDIWSSDRLQNNRIQLRKGNRESISICKYCDNAATIPW